MNLSLSLNERTDGSLPEGGQIARAVTKLVSRNKYGLQKDSIDMMHYEKAPCRQGKH